MHIPHQSLQNGKVRRREPTGRVVERSHSKTLDVHMDILQHHLSVSFFDALEVRH